MGRIEIDKEYLGFRYVIIMQEMGYRCGYVGMNKNNLFYGENYDSEIEIKNKEKKKQILQTHFDIEKKDIIHLFCNEGKI
jgi:hypothetical protein